MGKRAISITLDEDLIKTVKDLGENLSEYINTKLRFLLSCKNEVINEIDEFKRKIEVREKLIQSMDQHSEEKVENISEDLRIKLVRVKRIIRRNKKDLERVKELYGIHQKMVNKEFDKNYTYEEFKKIIENVEEDLEVGEEIVHG